MPNFSKLAAASAAGGFQYYDIPPDFSFSTPGQFLHFVSGGTYHHYENTLAIPKNNPQTAPTNIILTDVFLNVDVDDSANVYRFGNAGVEGGANLGSSGGFPIFYNYNVWVSSDANNVIITISVGNGSAVNSVTPPTITVEGKLFFYLAPF